jgi:hypothetical protein
MIVIQEKHQRLIRIVAMASVVVVVLRRTRRIVHIATSLAI